MNLLKRAYFVEIYLGTIGVGTIGTCSDKWIQSAELYLIRYEVKFHFKKMQII